MTFKEIEKDEFMQEFISNLRKPISEEERKQIEYYDREWEEVELMLQGS